MPTDFSEIALRAYQFLSVDDVRVPMSMMNDWITRAMTQIVALESESPFITELLGPLERTESKEIDNAGYCNLPQVSLKVRYNRITVNGRVVARVLSAGELPTKTDMFKQATLDEPWIVIVPHTAPEVSRVQFIPSLLSGRMAIVPYIAPPFQEDGQSYSELLTELLLAKTAIIAGQDLGDHEMEETGNRAWVEAMQIAQAGKVPK